MAAKEVKDILLLKYKKGRIVFAGLLFLFAIGTVSGFFAGMLGPGDNSGYDPDAARIWGYFLVIIYYPFLLVDYFGWPEKLGLVFAVGGISLLFNTYLIHLPFSFGLYRWDKRKPRQSPQVSGR